MRKILLLSDLHLENFNGRAANRLPPLVAAIKEAAKEVDGMFLVGDALPLYRMCPERYAWAKEYESPIYREDSAKQVEALREICGAFKQSFYIPGNHEFWGARYSELPNYQALWHKEASEALAGIPSLRILNSFMEASDFHEYKVIGSTWYTSLEEPLDRLRFPLVMVGEKDGPLDWDGHKWHDHHLVDQANMVAEMDRYPSDQKFIIMTHMAPDNKSVDLRRKGGQSNIYYMNQNVREVERIVYHGSGYWFHGHVHSSSTYELADYIVAARPFGYVPRGENPANRIYKNYIKRCIMEIE